MVDQNTVKSSNFTCFIMDFHGKEKDKKIYLEDFELTEEDLRVKTAKFKSPVKIDVTQTLWLVEIRYIYKTQFVKTYGGVIISGDYDETKGLYTYQTQGYQRYLTSKMMYVTPVAQADTPYSIYEILKDVCKIQVNIDSPLCEYYLAPVKEYAQYSSAAVDNEATGLNRKESVYFEDKTTYDILSSLVAASNCAIDLYVDENGKLHLDPLNLDEWENPKNIILTTRNLTGYTYKNDATNIISNVYVLNKKFYQNYTLNDPVEYRADSLGFADLIYYFGPLGTYVDNTEDSSQAATTNMTTDEEGNIIEDTSTPTESDVVDVVENEKLARQEYSDGLRDLMSFEIEFNGFIPELHTNMFIWFELPEKHILANYASMVAGIDRVSTRGGEYVLNRYYVEKITTTYNSNGVTTKVTLNPFASSLSSYNDIYKDAMDAWQQANCQTSTTNGSSGSTVTGTVSNGQRDMASTAEEALNRLPPDSAGTITVTGMPSTAGSTGGGSPYTYKRYTKTWRNYCPVCNMANTLKDNPKGVYEGEITCSSSLGGCDADWDSVTGRNKAGSCPNPGCTFNTVFLIDANNKRNSVGNINADVGGNSDGVVNTGGVSAVSGGTGQNCTTTTSGGSYDVPENVAQLANQMCNSNDPLQIVKTFTINLRQNINYSGYSNFINEPEKVVSTKRANCCDGTRLLFYMSAYKGVNTNDLIYRHIPGHVYGRYQGQDADWVKRAWNVHWGGGGVLKDTTFPTMPFGGDILDESYNVLIQERIVECFEKSILYENGYSSFNEKFEEEHEREIIDVEFDDMEYMLEKYGEYRWQ